MKKMLFVLVSLFAMNTFAGVVPRYFTKFFNGYSEQEVMLKAEEAIPGIVNLTDRRVRSEMDFERCTLDKRYVKIEGLKINKSYEYVNGELTIVYKGILKYSNKNCFEGR